VRFDMKRPCSGAGEGEGEGAGAGRTAERLATFLPCG